MTRILLSAPDVGPREEEALVRALRSGWVAPLGPEVSAFEDEVAARTGAGAAVALNSGTAALHLALVSWGIGPGDVVVTSSMTFAATANAVVYTGAEPYFVDSDETGNIDPALLNHALTRLRREGRRVRAVIPVDLLGKCADFDAVEAVAAAHGVRVLADAAESLGAARRGRRAGSWGHAAAVSFNGNKILTTSGGGMLLTPDPSLADHIRYLATQARRPVAHYEHVDVGYNYRLSNLLAAVGRAQLERFDAILARRRAIRDAYRSLVADLPGVRILGDPAPDDEDNCWLTAVVVDPATAGWSAADLGRRLAEADIESRPLWKPMHLQPVFARCGASVSGVSERLFETGVILPSGSGMSDADLERVLGVVRDVAPVAA